MDEIGEDSNQSNFISQFISETSTRITSLKSDDRILRKNILKELEKEITVHSSSFSEKDYRDVFGVVYKPLLLCLTDKVEKCRELSAKILKIFVGKLTDIEEYMPYIVGSLHLCLASSDERETSEEVRLIEIEILLEIVEHSDNNLLKYMNDIIQILSKCIVDSHPEIKRQSCICSAKLAFHNTKHFHMNSSSLIAPLLQTIAHQHSKTRIASIQAIGSVIQCGNNSSIEDVVSHLAQRLFDFSPAVRLSVVEVVGRWLLELPERYSYFHRLIPLLLSSLSDEVPEVRNKAKELWIKAGEQYLMENESDYKDKIDFPDAVKCDYPSEDDRPSLGCRILVQRYLSNILPALLHDIDDWLVETRVKSAKLLYLLLLHSEEKSVMKVQSFLDGIIHLVKDDNDTVVETANKTAELLGYFVDPRLWCDRVLTLIYDKPIAIYLSVLASCLRGRGKKPLDDCFGILCSTLSDPLICRLRKAEDQAHFLLCIEAIIASPDIIDSQASYQLFTVIITVAALTINETISRKADELLLFLSSQQSMENKAELYDIHLILLLEDITSSHQIWTAQSPEVLIFSYLIESVSGSAVQNAIRFSVPVIINNLQINKDPKLRSRFLSLTATVLKKLSLELKNECKEEIFTLVKNGLIPNLAWSGGKVSTAIRTIALANMWEVVQLENISSEMILATEKDFLPILSSLADDDSAANRMLACRILRKIMPILVKNIDDYKIHEICQEFLRCMDDECDDIRIEVTKMFKVYFKSFPYGYNWVSYNAFLKHLYRNMLIHMDDKKEEVRFEVFELLKDTAFTSPEILLNEAEAVQYMISSEDLCKELIDHIKNIELQNKD